MRLLLLCAILPIVFGAALPGQDKCAWGPPYWCSHVSHARECGATQHCLQTVWKNQIIKPTSTATCTYCQVVVNGMKDAFNSKTAQIFFRSGSFSKYARQNVRHLFSNFQELCTIILMTAFHEPLADAAEVLARVCSLLPKSDARDMCKGIVTENVEVLIEMFENDISTNTICATIGFCSGLEDTWSPYGVKARNTTDCADCRKFITDLQRSITSKEIVNQLEQLLNQALCSQLGSFSTECNDFVKLYLPVILQAMADEIDPDIVCRMLGFCTTDGKQLDVLKIKNVFASRKSRGPLRYRSSEECQICKDLFIQIDGLINDTSTQDKVKYELKNVVCTELGTLEDECKELVDEYLPWLFDLLLNELDPTTLCEEAGLCTVPSGPKVTPAKHVQPAAMVGPGSIQDTAECIVCTYIMKTVDTFLEENKTIITVEDFVENICNRLVTPQLAKQCNAFVAEYGQLVVDLLAKELDPKTICNKIGLCKTYMGIVRKLKGDGICEVCMLIVSELDTALANISTADIVKDFETLCGYLPSSSLSKTCISYVNDYVALIIDLIKAEDPRKLCSLAQMCNETVGTHMTKIIPEKQPIKSDVTCEVCNTLIFVLKYFVEDNATEAEIKTAVENLCERVPGFGSTCDKFIKEYGDRIIELLLQKVKPLVICRELELCEPVDKMAAVSVVMSPYDTLPLVQPTQHKIGSQSTGNVIECKMCKEFMNYLDNRLQENKTQENIKAVLEEMCSKFPSEVLTKCTQFVEKYTVAIINFVELDISPQEICQDLTLCTTRSLPQPVHITLLKDNGADKLKSGAECELCTLVITRVVKELKKNASEEEVKEVLDKVCSYLPDIYSSKCQEFVNNYTDQIIDLIIAGTDPTTICTEIGLCTTDTSSPWATLMKIIPEKTKGADKLKSGAECELCTLVVTQVENYLKDNTSEEIIQEELDKACKLVPDTKLANECTTIVNKYTAQIIKLIIAGMDPNEICTEIGLCPTDTSSPWATLVKIIPEKTKGADKLKAGAECELCTLMITKFADYLKENKSEEIIQEELDKACELVPETKLANECKTFVNKYTAQIIKLIIAGTDPTTICTEIGLCQADTLSPWATLAKIIPEKTKGADKLKSGAECELCTLMINKVVNYLKENKSEEFIQEELDKACKLVPETKLANECTIFVNKYTAQIIQLIIAGTDPNEICTMFGLCPTDTLSPWATMVKIIPEKTEGIDLCPVCKFVVEDLQKILKQNRTVYKVEQFMKNVCDVLPDTLTSQCHDNVDKYIPEILAQISNSLKPEEICQTLGLCNVTRTDKKDDATLYFKPHRLVGQDRMVGEHECTYGPAYWCASRSNAAKCGAVDHCTKHVWN